MIYLIDIPNSDHAAYLCAAISMFSDVRISITPVESLMAVKELAMIFENLISTVRPQDIILIPWNVTKNEILNSSISSLTDKCFVVAAAGNTAENIENFSPASVPSVITVGALNKSGVPAKFSSRSPIREIYWAPGTNIIIDGEPRSGTSVAAAIYAAFLANAIAAEDLSLVNSEIDRIKSKFYNELNS